MSVGTEITYGESMVPDEGWKQCLDHKWNREIVVEESAKFPELVSQVSIFIVVSDDPTQLPTKLTYIYHSVM